MKYFSVLVVKCSKNGNYYSPDDDFQYSLTFIL